jgi:hypothetical protein
MNKKVVTTKYEGKTIGKKRELQIPLLSLEPANAAYAENNSVRTCVKHHKKDSFNPSIIFNDLYVVLISVAYPDSGSGIRCLFDSWIRDPAYA